MPHGEYTRLIKLDESQREAVFNRMDHPQPMEARGPVKKSHNRRHDKRWNYRESDIAVIVEHPGGGVSRLLVCGRNLSAGGLSFLHGGFLHPGSRCRLSLRQTDGENHPLTGKIVSCRHVERTLHEIGLKFDKRIDPVQFIQPNADGSTKPGESLALAALDGCVLYLDDSSADQNLMRFYLESCGAKVQAAGNGIEGMSLLEQGQFIAVITEIGLPGLSGVEIAQAIRAGGDRTPIIAVTADERESVRKQATARGCDAVLIKPLDFAQLTRLLRRLVNARQAERGDQPLLSTRWSDEKMRPLILSFLDELEREARQLTEFMSAGDVDSIRRICLTLKGSAGGYGYPQIGQAAQDLLKQIDQKSGVEQWRGRFGDLISKCHAANAARGLADAA